MLLKPVEVPDHMHDGQQHCQSDRLTIRTTQSVQLYRNRGRSGRYGTIIELYCCQRPGLSTDLLHIRSERLEAGSRLQVVRSMVRRRAGLLKASFASQRCQKGIRRVRRVSNNFLSYLVSISIRITYRLQLQQQKRYKRKKDLLDKLTKTPRWWASSAPWMGWRRRCQPDNCQIPLQILYWHSGKPPNSIKIRIRIIPRIGMRDITIAGDLCLPLPNLSGDPLLVFDAPGIKTPTLADNRASI